MCLNSVFMLNYPLGLTLIQSSLKALNGRCDRKIQHAHTHTHMHTHTATRAHMAHIKKRTLFQSCNSFRKTSLYRRRPSLRLQRHTSEHISSVLMRPYFSKRKKVTRTPLCIPVLFECNKLCSGFFFDPKFVQQVNFFFFLNLFWFILF